MHSFQTAAIWMILIAILYFPNPSRPLNCDKEFTYFENYGKNGFNVSCNEISKGYEHMLQNITIFNEVSLSLTNSTLENIHSNIFTRLGRIKSLSIINSKLSYDKSEPLFTKLIQLETLEIKNTNFEVFENTLKSLSKLRYLIFSNNSLNKIEQGAFKDLENVEKLEITNNKFKNLEDLNLCELPRLKTLNLRLNNLTNNRLFSFSCQKSSNSLDFSINANTETLFSKESFFNISTDTTLDLVDLDLSSNQILDLGHLLDGLDTLLRLNLDNNKINSINYSSFESVRKLEKISMANNLVDSVDAKIFSNETNLKHLDLSFNKLTSFNISNVPKLEFLDLGNNNLQNVYLKYLVKLKSLNLDCNRLSNLEPLFFRKVPNLVTLKFCGNEVTLKRNFFKEVPKLEVLILKNNSIALLPEYSFFGLRNLRILDLSVNNLSVITKEAFWDLQNLEILNISYNALEVLNYGAVQSLKSLTTLDLTNNKIKTFEYDIIFTNLRGLSTVYIRENFLTCDFLQNMISFVKKRGITFTVSEKIDYNSENVVGIPCVDPIIEDASIVAKKPTKGSSVVFDLGISVASIFGLLLIGIISYRAYIYLKRRMYKADEFELINE